MHFLWPCTVAYSNWNQIYLLGAHYNHRHHRVSAASAASVVDTRVFLIGTNLICWPSDSESGFKLALPSPPPQLYYCGRHHHSHCCGCCWDRESLVQEETFNAQQRSITAISCCTVVVCGWWANRLRMDSLFPVLLLFRYEFNWRCLSVSAVVAFPADLAFTALLFPMIPQFGGG